MIDDLQLKPPCQTIKFVDDTTIFEIVDKKSWSSTIGAGIQEVLKWTTTNNMQLNPTKTKELLIDFSKKRTPDVQPIIIDSTVVKNFPFVKLLGVTISSDLKWNLHVDNIVKKASKRIFSLIVLKRSGGSCKDLLQVYKTQIRPVLEYACQCWHPGLTRGLSDMIESVQRRALRIAYPDCSYREALHKCGIDTLQCRRSDLCQKYFNKIQLLDHKLNCLLPDTRAVKYNLRENVQFSVPRLRTVRGEHSFINWCVLNK